jgi:hypothetical protein
LIAGNGEAPDVTANDATLLLFRGKESLDWQICGDLTAEEVSRLGIIDSIIAGEEKQKKSAKMDLMEFTAAADNGLLWHQNNGGAMVQIAMDRLAPTAPNRMILLRRLNNEIATTYGGIPDAQANWSPNGSC